MKQLKIKDNDQRKKEEYFEVQGIVNTIADKTLEELEKEGVFVFPEMVRDAEDITRDQMILQSINDTYRTGNVMGFLGYGEERLVIESRFSTGNNDYLLFFYFNCCFIRKQMHLEKKYQAVNPSAFPVKTIYTIYRGIDNFSHRKY